MLPTLHTLCCTLTLVRSANIEEPISVFAVPLKPNNSHLDLQLQSMIKSLRLLPILILIEDYPALIVTYTYVSLMSVHPNFFSIVGTRNSKQFLSAHMPGNQRQAGNFVSDLSRELEEPGRHAIVRSYIFQGRSTYGQVYTFSAENLAANMAVGRDLVPQESCELGIMFVIHSNQVFFRFKDYYHKCVL